MTSLFADRCTAACHGPGTTQIDLISSGVEERLIDQASTSELCKNRKYVTIDGSPSLLLQKLQLMPPCGLRMPLGEPLDEPDMMCISTWIDAVAEASGGS